MKYLIALIFLFVALIFEVSLVSLPLVLVLLIVLSVIYKDYSVFVLGMVFGILRDMLTFSIVGVTSIFFISLIFIILSYQKKFEITSSYFVIFAIVVFGSLYLLMVGPSFIILKIIVSILLGVIFFAVFKKLYKSNFLITNS